MTVIDPIDMHMKRAALCAGSIPANEHRFQLIANDAKALRRRSQTLTAAR